MQSALLLNADMSFHSFVHWQRAICLSLSNVVNVLERYEDEVRTVSFSIRIPAVLQLRKYVKRRPRVKMTRANLLARDKYQCLYCGDKLKMSEFTQDHVIPSSEGGRRTWENIASSCLPCNHKKRNRTPKQAGMPLLQKPYKPCESEMVNLIFSGKSIHELWRSYVYWNIELENDNEKED